MRAIGYKAELPSWPGKFVVLESKWWLAWNVRLGGREGETYGVDRQAENPDVEKKVTDR